MAQKIISININTAAIKSGASYEEIEFEQLQQHLDNDYKIIDMHQIAPSETSNFFNITFVLEKP